MKVCPKLLVSSFLLNSDTRLSFFCSSIEDAQRGMLFPKETVSLEEGKRKGYLHKPSQLVSKFLAEMEEEQVDLSTHQAAATFMKATVEDMPAAVALAADVFGGLNTIPVEIRVAWLRKNPDIDYLVKQGSPKKWLAGFASQLVRYSEMLSVGREKLFNTKYLLSAH